MTKLLKKHGTVTIIVLSVLIIGGLALASNMGFKLVYTYYATGASAKTGTNWTAFPMNFPFANASALKGDIPNCTQVTRHVRAYDTFQSYTGGRGSVNFTIDPGVAYIVKVSTDTNYVVVGSFAPGAGVPLNATGVGSKTGTNWTSVPYHTTAGNAASLKADIPNCTQVTRHVRAYDTFQSYTGGRGSVNFTIVPGEGYIVKVSTDTSWLPSHY